MAILVKVIPSLVSKLIPTVTGEKWPDPLCLDKDPGVSVEEVLKQTLLNRHCRGVTQTLKFYF